MLIVLSPAKSLDFETPVKTRTTTTPHFLAEAEELIEVVRTYSADQLGSLMDISQALAQLNVQRFSDWMPQPAARHSKQAVFAFNGDVYEGLDVASLTSSQLKYLQNHLRILSGLYGLLRPLDALQAYRLEMGTALANQYGKNLYSFWGDKISLLLSDAIQQHKSQILVNLASDEYFKAVRPAVLGAKIISPVFQDWKNGQYKIISFYAKRARGLMARYCAQHGIRKVNDLKAFAEEAYAYCEEESTSTEWVFRRKIED
ncbi:peroxide stress protein YaaA [Undibacterium sp. Tian12W]|uniref:peroxide stress protein YaaA n=1 Tax=Undibacterium sp. Tian12W TaxID=3413054 RepID=UPI003BEFD890